MEDPTINYKRAEGITRANPEARVKKEEKKKKKKKTRKEEEEEEQKKGIHLK